MRCVRCVSCRRFAPGMRKVTRAGCTSRGRRRPLWSRKPRCACEAQHRPSSRHSGRGLVRKDPGSQRRMLPVSGSTTGPRVLVALPGHVSSARPLESPVRRVPPESDQASSRVGCVRVPHRSLRETSTTGCGQDTRGRWAGRWRTPASCCRRARSSSVVYTGSNRDRGSLSGHARHLESRHTGGFVLVVDNSVAIFLDHLLFPEYSSFIFFF